MERGNGFVGVFSWFLGGDSARSLRSRRNGAYLRVRPRGRRWAAGINCRCRKLHGRRPSSPLFPLYAAHHSASDGRNWRNLLRSKTYFHKTIDARRPTACQLTVITRCHWETQPAITTRNGFSVFPCSTYRSLMSAAPIHNECLAFIARSRTVLQWKSVGNQGVGIGRDTNFCSRFDNSVIQFELVFEV